MSREFDIILWGCTGFTGKLVARLVAQLHGLSDKNIKIALAGRSRSRLQDVAILMFSEALNSTNSNVRSETQSMQIEIDNNPELTKSIIPLIVTPGWGDDEKATDQMAADMARRTVVLLAMSGPFAEVGEPLLKACASNGTDYVDITGEYLWVKHMFNKYNDLAIKHKARIIPCCGYDYLLNDIGITAIQRHAITLTGKPIQEIHQIPYSVGSSVSSGTFRTLCKMLKSISIKELFGGKDDAFSMCNQPPALEIIYMNKDLNLPYYSYLTNSWLYPSIMGRGMTRFVHIKNNIYGQNFKLVIGEESSWRIVAAAKSIMHIVGAITLFVASRLPAYSLMLDKSGSGKDIKELQKAGNCVELTTVGKLPATINGSELKITHSIRFTKGEAYLMTAYGIYCSAMTCLQKRKANDLKDDVYGVGCPSKLLGLQIEDKLRSSGFIAELSETS